MNRLDDLIEQHVQRTHAAVSDLTLRPLDFDAPPKRRQTTALAVAIAAVVLLVTVLNLIFLPRAQDPAEDPQPGAHFSATGSLHQECSWCPAVLLQDGRVLVVDQKAEIYDPTTGEFTVEGSARYRYNQGTAVLLPDGRVLLLSAAYQIGAEIYDPATGSFDEQESPEQFVQSASLMESGEVFLIDHDGWAQVFDPATGRYRQITARSAARGDVVAATLDDGRILVAGSVAETFDATTGIFTRISPWSLGRPEAAVKFTDGRVAIVGESKVGLFDPATDTLTTAKLEISRFWIAAAALHDGRVVILGGAGATAEVFDPMTGESKLLDAPMTQERQAATAVTLDDGRVLIFGHYKGNILDPKVIYPSSSAAEIFTP